MHVIRVPEDKLVAFQAALEARGAHHLETKNPHEAFRVEMGRWPLVAYTSGKATFEEDQLVEVLEGALAEVLDGVNVPVVGSDEAGKGEWLGPLVVAACAVLPGQRPQLVARGVMDSKDVAAGNRARVARAIEEVCPHHQVVLVAPERFNQLFGDFKAEGKGLNDLLAWAHARAIGDVIEALEQEDLAGGARVIVDEFDRVRTQARTAATFDVDTYPVTQRVRAEDEVAVAAASVLARQARERWIDAYEQREKVPVRSLTREDARAHEKKDAFAKTSWL